MKRIDAIIYDSKFEKVQYALCEVGIDLISYRDAKAKNEIHNVEQCYRRTICDANYISRQLLTIIVRDINVQKTINAIQKCLKSGNANNIKISISTI